MACIIAHWREKTVNNLGNLSLASSIGGTVFSVAFRNLNAAVGYAQVIFCRYNPLISLQIRMVDENHLLCLNAYPGNYESGKRYRPSRLCPLTSITVIRDITDAETQTSSSPGAYSTQSSSSRPLNPYTPHPFL
jgi:hypothetical protein